jgi:GntR family transcriptional repressor for pyruvate dehydrogenase complex
MTFEKVGHSTFKKKSSIIADQLLNKIRSGEYKIGGKLPSERVIAEQMGVSRPSLREAVSALQIVGILESRPGDGTYVAAPPTNEDVTLKALIALEESDSPFDVLQARRAMEIGVARLAVAVARDEDIRMIKRAWEQKYQMGRRGDYEAYIRAGRDVHLAIARATRNRLIEKLMEELLDAMNQTLWVNMRESFYEEHPDRIERMVEIHNNIVAAMEERDPDKITRALEADFDTQFQRFYDHMDDNQPAD